MIKELKMANKDYTIKELCDVFGQKPSTYYDQVKEKPACPEKLEIIRILKESAIESGNTYGKRRMKEALEHEGIEIGLYKTASLMKLACVKAIKPTKKHYYPDDGESNEHVDNVLDRQFDQPTVNTHWVDNIT